MGISAELRKPMTRREALELGVMAAAIAFSGIAFDVLVNGGRPGKEEDDEPP